MIRCNNCYRTFASDDDMPILHEHSDGTVDEKYDENVIESYKGCPDCKTDVYLMDLDEDDESVQ